MELAKAKAIQRMESEDEESTGGILGSGLSHDLDGDIGHEIDKVELINVVKLLGSKLEDLQTCHDLIVKHGLALQRSLSELDTGTGSQPHLKTRENVRAKRRLTITKGTILFNLYCQQSQKSNKGKKWVTKMQLN